MKLNNKGFAITSILYGLLILFALLVASYLTILTARKNRLDDIIENIEKEYNENFNETLYTVTIVQSTDTTTTLETATVNSGNSYSYVFNPNLIGYNFSGAVCTNGQVVTVTETTVKNGRLNVIMKKLSIANVVSDTTCTLNYNASMLVSGDEMIKPVQPKPGYETS